MNYQNLGLNRKNILKYALIYLFFFLGTLLLPKIFRVSSTYVVSTFFPSATPTYTPTVTPSVTPTSTPSLTPTPTSRPTNTPTPVPTLVDGAQLLEYVNQAAAHFGVDRDLLLRIGNCESGMNSNAKYLDYGGIFQFDTRTWQSTRRAQNLSPDPALRFDAKESIFTAAFKLSTGGKNAWPNCSQ